MKTLLEKRFAAHLHRHPTLAWEEAAAALDHTPGAWAAAEAMEASGGEPDVVELQPGRLALVDCAPESPKGRRSLCYDRAGLESRKDFPPAGTAVEHAASLGIALLSEEEYHQLQQIEPFDRKTSSWILTPASVRTHGGALFVDCRYGRSFTYHNGAGSYYAARGYRGIFHLKTP